MIYAEVTIRRDSDGAVLFKTTVPGLEWSNTFDWRTYDIPVLDGGRRFLGFSLYGVSDSSLSPKGPGEKP